MQVPKQKKKTLFLGNSVHLKFY